jgi:putative holliday junction resolvase
MRALGLDIGDKKIGIALSDDCKIIALPLIVLANDEAFFHSLQSIIEEKNVDVVVVGVPYTLKGELGHQAKKIMGFIDEIKKRIDKKIVLIDERFTTKMSKEMVKDCKREEIDKYSAAIILESFLNHEKHN